MAGYRMDRINEDVMREICSIFRNLKDPRISKMLSVVRVEVTNDLSYATIYVSALDGLDAAKESVKGLKSAAGYIRHELGARLKLRHVPELRFVADNSIEKSAEIAGIINSFTDKGDSDGNS